MAWNEWMVMMMVGCLVMVIKMCQGVAVEAAAAMVIQQTSVMSAQLNHPIPWDIQALKNKPSWQIDVTTLH